jgi:transposase
VLNGILWVLRTGAPWADVPERYPSFQTCHRRFQQWVRSGVMKGILEALALEGDSSPNHLPAASPDEKRGKPTPSVGGRQPHDERVYDDKHGEAYGKLAVK